LARQLAPALNLPLIDKDDCLERLFERKGVGDVAWRRSLSRESDLMLTAEAAASDGAVLVSHWRLPGMPSDSGTPTSWLLELSNYIVNVHCACSAEVAAERFCGRKRHPGHLDSGLAYLDVLAGIRVTAGHGLLEIGQRVDVDTSQEPMLDVVVRDIHSAFGRCTISE
jgi:hypothetical protein